VIAEQFGTLESLFPGRIDLGLGRAPGSDPLTARALRRNLASDPDAFPADVIELKEYFEAPAMDAPGTDASAIGLPAAGQRVRAIPGAGLQVPLWILGSSLFGAQVAAALGLPFAFASHFAPAAMMQAIDLYRGRFRPSRQLQKPHLMLGFNVFAADDDEQGELLASSMQQAFVNLRSGRPTPLPPPQAGYHDRLPAAAKAMLADVLSCSAIGSATTVERALQSFVERTQPDEVMISSQIFDHAARLRSFEITANLRNAGPAWRRVEREPGSARLAAQ
jgi:luciferase family oxidoreductase group 1